MVTARNRIPSDLWGTAPNYIIRNISRDRPNIEHADFLIDSCTKAKVDKLYGIQRRAVQVIDRYHYKGLLYEDLLLLYGLDELVTRRKNHQLAPNYGQSKYISFFDKNGPEVTLRTISGITTRNTILSVFFGYSPKGCNKKHL